MIIEILDYFAKTIEVDVSASQPLIDLKIGDRDLNHLLKEKNIYLISKSGKYRITLQVRRIGDLEKETSGK